MEYNGAMPADAGCTARRRRRGFARIRAPYNQATLYGTWDFVELHQPVAAMDPSHDRSSSFSSKLVRFIFL